MLWTLNTITINPPAAYDGLTDNEKFSYQVALGWAKNAELTFNANGTVVTGGDWDFGYQSWKLINNDTDIEVSLAAGMDTLREWLANNTKFTYVSPVGGSFNCTFVYK